MSSPQMDELMLIGGKLVSSRSGATFPNVNPATEETICAVPDATAEDIDEAISAARRAHPQNRNKSPARR